MRMRRLWDAKDILNLIRSTRAVHELDKRLQTNYRQNTDVYELAQQLKYPLQVVNESTTKCMWIFATTCHEHFVDTLVEYAKRSSKANCNAGNGSIRSENDRTDPNR